MKEIFLLCSILSNPPWEGEYGTKTKLWTEVESSFSAQKNYEGELLFGGKDISSNLYQDQYKVLVGWVNQFQKDQPWQSGHNHNNTQGKMLQLLEERNAF